MAVFRTVIRSDLQKPLVVQQLSGNMFTADNASNEIAVEVTNGGEPVALSGAVTAYAVRADGVTAMFSGTISGNVASVVLPASCYVEVGTLSIVIKVGSTTVGACTSYVYQTTTDTIVDPGHVIPSIEELLAQIDACIAATAGATAAAASANTAAGNANTKAGLAETAAGNANTAAGKIDNMTVEATTLPAGSQATVSVTEVDGHKHIEFGVPKGESGNETIDDTAGEGDIDKVWSADKTLKEVDSKADVICKTIDTPASIVTIEDGADDLPVREMRIGIEPVQEGTGDPSPDNVRPITGWTGCNVQRTGKNLIPNNYSSRTINGVTFSVNNDGSISVSGTPTGNATFQMTFDVNADLGVVVLNGIDYATNIMWDTVTLFTASNETIAKLNQTVDKERIIDLSQYPTVARMSVVFKRKVNDEEVSGTVYPMLRKQSESADWEPYIGTTCLIAFPETVYGGNLTIHADGTGELVVDMFLRRLYNAYPTGWRTRLVSSNTIRQYYHGHDSAMVRSNDTDICTHAVNQSGSTPDKVRFTTSDMVYISFPIDKAPGETAEAFQSWLEEQDSNGTPVAICYTRKKPISYQLSVPQVRTLLGLNNIWADAGNIDLLTYPVDTAMALDNQITATHGMIAGTDTIVATESHAVGDVFICNNKLYKATATIAVGESIIEGSNVVQTNVAELLLNRPDFVFNAAVMKNHPVSITLGNQSRAIVFATGANAERVALISLLGGSTQAYAWDIHASAQLTATIDGSTVTLAYSGAGSCFMDILKLSGNVTATMA